MLSQCNEPSQCDLWQRLPNSFPVPGGGWATGIAPLLARREGYIWINFPFFRVMWAVYVVWGHWFHSSNPLWGVRLSKSPTLASCEVQAQVNPPNWFPFSPVSEVNGVMNDVSISTNAFVSLNSSICKILRRPYGFLATDGSRVPNEEILPSRGPPFLRFLDLITVLLLVQYLRPYLWSCHLAQESPPTILGKPRVPVCPIERDIGEKSERREPPPRALPLHHRRHLHWGRRARPVSWSRRLERIHLTRPFFFHRWGVGLRERTWRSFLWRLFIYYFCKLMLIGLFPSRFQ